MRSQRKADKLAQRTAKRVKKSTEKVVPSKQLKSFTKSAEKVATKTAKSVQKTVGSDENKLWARRWLKGLAVPVKMIGSMFANLVPESWRTRLQKMAKPFGKGFKRFGKFTQGYFKSRDYWQLVYGLPASVLVLPVIGSLLAASIIGDDSARRRYQAAADEATEAKEFARADLMYRKLAQLGLSRSSEFKQAQALADAGDYENARQQMTRLAEAGNLDAHIWIAYQALMTENLELEQDERYALAEKHARALLVARPNHAVVNRILIRTLVDQQRWSEAIPLLERWGSDAEDLKPFLLKGHVSVGEQSSARVVARSYAAAMKRKFEAGAESFTAEEYSNWVFATEIAGQIEEAFQLAGMARQQMPDNSYVEQSYLRLGGQLFDGITGDTSSPHFRSPELLATLMNIDAEQMLERLHSLVGQHGAQSTVIQEVTTPLNDQAKHWAYYGIASVLWSSGERSAARSYFLKSHKLDQENPIVANDLAYCLLEMNGSMQQALELANIAIENDSIRRPEYYETRGQILLRMNRWQEAVRDLEDALNGLPSEQRAIHRALATAHAELGNRELSQIHARQSISTQ